MAELPVDQSLKKIKFLYRLSGMNIEDRDKNTSEKAVYMFNFLWILTDIILAIEWGIVGFVKGLDFIQITHVLPCLNLGMLTEMKTLYLVLYEKKLKQLLRDLRDLERIRLPNNSYAKKIADTDAKFLHNLIKVTWTVNFCLMILFNSGPLALMAVKYYLTGKLELFLPFLDVYPFDSYDLKYWPWAYLHEVWTACIVLSEIFAVDFLFYVCCTHIGIQFKVLKRELEQLITGKGLLADRDDQLKEKLADIVRWHQQIISCAEMLEVMYSKSTLFNYISSSLIICLTGFNSMVIDDMAIVISFFMLAVVEVLQIFFLCYFGGKLIDSSTDVSSGAYNSKWYLTDIPTRKTILLIQTRAQNPCKLTAAGFADVNLRAFMKILSTSWSYFALLQTMYGSSKVSH
uniref:Odorant receptor n=1 Tax=Conogethes pinicolalis TaxID=1178461 RepID=A0A5B9GC00_9NEOP|nr:odorant receptor 23 [Conogethes pinicolalis]